MIVLRDIEQVTRDRNSVITVGSFDGVHLAHQEIIREVVHRARMREGRSVLVTFDPHPSTVVAPERSPVPLLTTLNERIALLEDLHIDLVCVIAFTREFSLLSSEQFYQSYIVDRIGVSEVVVGYDHMFGHRRKAGVHELVAMGTAFDFSVYAAHPVRKGGETIGSTLIRRMLLEGRVAEANELLGHPYSLAGTVVRGDGLGKTLGFPTANLSVEDTRKLIPGRGVYVVGVTLEYGEHFGMLNIGRRPTVKADGDESVEVHILGLSRDVYDHPIRITFLERLRDERKFGSREELMTQLHLDKTESERRISAYKQKP